MCKQDTSPGCCLRRRWGEEWSQGVCHTPTLRMQWSGPHSREWWAAVTGVDCLGISSTWCRASSWQKQGATVGRCPRGLIMVPLLFLPKNVFLSHDSPHVSNKKGGNIFLCSSEPLVSLPCFCWPLPPHHVLPLPRVQNWMVTPLVLCYAFYNINI